MFNRISISYRIGIKHELYARQVWIYKLNDIILLYIILGADAMKLCEMYTSVIYRVVLVETYSGYKDEYNWFLSTFAIERLFVWGRSK